MKRQFSNTLIAGFFAEVLSSWWRWVRAPTDDLRALYRGSFLAYQGPRLVPWAVAIVFALTVVLLIEKRSQDKAR